MHIAKKMLALASLAMAITAAPASAKTINLAGDFASPVFSYGTVNSSNSFTKFSQSNCGDIGVSGTCFRGSDKYQVEFKLNGNTLLLHPGPNDGQNSMVMFTAPRSGTYTFNTKFTRGDTGDGVGILSFGTGGLTPIGRVDGATPTFSYNGSQFIAKGQMVGLGVDRGGANSTYFNDSTQLSGSISGAVPEPAVWAMMILGFGVIGAALRRRVKLSEVRFNNKIQAIAAS